MATDLKDRVAVITGGTSGIGLAIAEALGRQGMRLAVCGRNTAALKRAGRRLEALTEVVATRADVARERDVEQFVGAALQAFRRIDLLVNNAGIGGEWERVEKLSPRAFDETIAINLRGAFLCARAAFPHLKKTAGWIVNISSIAGKEGIASAGAYSASKFGMIGLSRTLQEEGRPSGIRSTAICPGYVHTPLVAGAPVAPERMIQPEDIAATVLYLLRLSPTVVIHEIVMERLDAE